MRRFPMQIKEVRFGMADLDASEAFYRDVLDLPVRRTSTQLVIRAGWAEVVLSEGDVSAGAQHLAFTIPRNRLREAKDRLAGGAELLSADGEDEF